VLTQKDLLASFQEVQGFIDTYMRSFPGLFKWREKTVRESRINGYVVTSAGRRMVVTNSTDSNSIVNFPVQGTGSDGYKIALLLLDGKLMDLDARVVHILHDEIIVEAKADIAGQVAKVLKGCMEKAFVEMKLGVPMKVVPVEGEAWGLK